MNKKKFIFWIGGILLFILLLIAFNRYFVAKWALGFVERADIHWLGFTERKYVALTFDDGPDPRFTPKILAILKRYRVPAAFFVVGSNVDKYPDILSRTIEAGHEIGNHTLTHPHLCKLGRAKIMRQIAATDERIYRAVGIHAPLFRPPYQELNEAIIASARDLHYRIVLSTITLEHGNKKKPLREVRRVLKMVFPGAIILAHDGRLDRTYTVVALPKLIEGLKAKGYRIVPLGKLLGTQF